MLLTPRKQERVLLRPLLKTGNKETMVLISKVSTDSRECFSSLRKTSRMERYTKGKDEEKRAKPRPRNKGAGDAKEHSCT